MFATESKKKYFKYITTQESSKEIRNYLTMKWIETTLGTMLAIADNKKLYLLEFIECINLEYKIKRLKEKTKSRIESGETVVIISIENELKHYFKGVLTTFKTPINIIGTSFQKKVWQELLNIPYGITKSYTDIAKTLNKPFAFRAIARANAVNQLAIVIPCHRVINKNGTLSGYAAGKEKKELLLSHEA